MKSVLLFLLIFTSFSLHAQESLEKLLKKHNTKSVPYISVQELAMPKTEAVILDAREIDEYNTSHLQDALFVGYDHFNLAETTKNLKDKEQQIVVYCSLGIRSEDVAEKLQAAGYTNVTNLYGGIFEWKNNNFPVYNLEEKETEDVHTFSKTWSKWLLKGNRIFKEEKEDE
ncbi:rhodanese-like domain-containing protein [Lacinutrix himadriensis]|uniref:rhodanese-like domain-containing protein n=1 Tax=Lacinutrix himadriensis TaxID=641549 RepID=UPI0006E2C139|nr:rhodanese-like domain-containing protein [Lacinutrix himadriensis]